MSRENPFLERTIQTITTSFLQKRKTSGHIYATKTSSASKSSSSGTLERATSSTTRNLMIQMNLTRSTVMRRMVAQRREDSTYNQETDMMLVLKTRMMTTRKRAMTTSWTDSLPRCRLSRLKTENQPRICRNKSKRKSRRSATMLP